MPFAWSPRCVLMLCRLKSLEKVSLGKYISVSPTRELFDTFWRGLPNLTHAIISLTLKPSDKHCLYSISHAKLKYLDIQDCWWFYLRKLHTPSLEVLYIEYRPDEPLHVQGGFHEPIPCIYQLLVKGAPALRILTGHRLRPGWRESVYPELERLLRNICPCSEHLQ